MAVSETGRTVDPLSMFRPLPEGRVEPKNFQNLATTGLVDHAVRILTIPSSVAAMSRGGNTPEDMREMWRGVFASADRLHYELPGYAEAYRVMTG